MKDRHKEPRFRVSFDKLYNELRNKKNGEKGGVIQWLKNLLQKH